MKIGIDFDRVSRSHKLWLKCGDCGKYFRPLDAMDYLERLFGTHEGVEYWRKLRNQIEQMKIEKKHGVTFEGFWLPK